MSGDLFSIFQWGKFTVQRCEKCRGMVPLTLPASVYAVTYELEEFMKKHKKCKVKQ